jgi:hypothetical protein
VQVRWLRRSRKRALLNVISRLRTGSAGVRTGRGLSLSVAAIGIGALASPAVAGAHGIFGRAYLPVPAWLFAWAAGAVLVISFVVLPRLWSAPRFEHATQRRLLSLPAALDPLCGVIGISVFTIVVVSGVRGSQIPTANLAPTAVFVLFWVGIPVLSALLGDIFRPFNPWRALARGLVFGTRRLRLERRLIADPLPYPPWLGRWPAVVGIVAFAWLELIFVGREQPATLAVLAVAYALVQLVGMAFVGIERWSELGDAFGVAFNLFSRLSPLLYHDRAVWRRPTLSGLAELRELPGTVPLLCAMIGTTTFDGFMNGPVWRSIAPSLERDLSRLGLGGTAALELTSTLGMAACILLCAGLYRIGVQGMSSVSPRHPARELARRFEHSLAPIAFGYLLAHYFSLLVTQGQATGYLISDPMGTGANIFGTASWKIDYGLVSAALIWYVQVGALVGGHVSGLALAHDRALVVYGDVNEAAESQRWMLVVMVTFTCLGLWLLSAVNA